jgi:hypothetical protein
MNCPAAGHRLARTTAAAAALVTVALAVTACGGSSADRTKACAASRAGDEAAGKFDTVNDIASFKKLVAEQVNHLDDFAKYAPKDIKADAQSQLSAAKKLQLIVDASSSQADLTAKSVDIKAATDLAAASQVKIAAWTKSNCG